MGLIFTSDGISIPTQQEIEDGLISRLQYHIDSNINTSPDLLLGQLTTVLSEAIAKVYEVQQFSHSQHRVQSAIGSGLDDLGILKGLSRLQATQSSLNIVANGLPDTLIPKDSQVEDTKTGEKFITTVNKRLALASCTEAILQIEDNTPSFTFTISFNGVDYSFSHPAVFPNPLDQRVFRAYDFAGALGLIPDIQTRTTLSGYSSRAFSIKNTANNPMVITISSGISCLNVSSSIACKSITYGVLSQPTGDFRILTPISGWLSTSLQQGSFSSGRNIEGDEDFRTRIINSNSISQKGTTAAVLNNLTNTTGVIKASVLENTTPIIHDGIPAYGIHCIVMGGTDQAIAKVIWETKGTCTPLAGSVEVTYVDDFNISRLVKFSRPTTLNLECEVEYSLYSEEDYQPDASIAIQLAVVSHVNSLGLGKDVIPSRCYSEIYKNTTGINVTSIKFKQLGDPAPFSSDVFPIPATSVAQISVNDIVVNLV